MKNLVFYLFFYVVVGDAKFQRASRHIHKRSVTDIDTREQIYYEKVALGDNKLLAISEDKEIWYREGLNGRYSYGSKWKQLEGELVSVAVGGGKIVGANYANYVRMGIDAKNPFGTKWHAINGDTLEMAVGAGKIVGVTKIGTVWGRTKIRAARKYGKNWKEIGGTLKQVSVGDDKILGVNAAGDVFYREGISGGHPYGLSWKTLEGKKLDCIAAGDGKIMGCDALTNIWYRTGINQQHPYGTNWVQMNGYAQQVSVNDGKIVALINGIIYGRMGISAMKPYGISWTPPVVGQEGVFPQNPTKGQPFPQPQSIKSMSGNAPLVILPDNFKIIPIGYECDILSNAMKRYAHLIRLGEAPGGIFDNRNDVIKKSSHVNTTKKTCQQEAGTVAISELHIDIKTPCEGHVYPEETSKEQYSLKVDQSGGVIKATEVWGALRALETFSQLVFTNKATNCLQLAQTQVEDFPRFAYRGLMLDTSRHFLPKGILLRNLDAMSYSKLNVFHWHIVDSSSFPYQSETYPNLSAEGAFDPVTHVYTKEDVAEIVEHARLRGIRVIPEFDTPAHSHSWQGLPNFVTPCYTGNKKNGLFGPVNPSKNSTFEYLENLVKEWKKVFPDKTLHLGGDEVPYSCWLSNPEIKEFMKTKGLNSGRDLERYYFERLLKIVKAQGKTPMIWNDPYDEGYRPSTENIVIQDWNGDISKQTKSGYKSVFTSINCWYLNLLWNPYDLTILFQKYKCDPQGFNGTPDQLKLVIGGEAPMWGSFAGSSQQIPNTWPQAAVIAERLWSARTVTDGFEMLTRLAEMQCRFLHRGVPAGVLSGQGYCDKEWDIAS